MRRLRSRDRRSGNRNDAAGLKATIAGASLICRRPPPTIPRGTCRTDSLVREQRRLAAIVSADVAGYSRLMGRDESGTLAALKTLRIEVVDPRIAAHGGRIVKTTGDGLLVEFPSVVDAVRCVVDVQTEMAGRGAAMPEHRRIAFRIGLNLGDIIVEDGDIFGDGVNIAARLQEMAPTGGLCVSDRVHDDVRDRLDARFEDLGPRTLQGIARPVHVWRWLPAGATQTSAAATIAEIDAPLALPDKPSIAVLPFDNMERRSAAGVFHRRHHRRHHHLELARFHELFPWIARNSSFSYKGKSAGRTSRVGCELGVRYHVLEGSIRKAANRIRVYPAELVDAATGAQIWAERYDRVLEDIFAVQEELTRSIVRAIAPQIVDAETAKVARRWPENLSAYEVAVQASAKTFDAWVKSDRVLRDAAIADARQALAIDPGSVIALASLAFGQWQHIAYVTAADRPDRGVERGDGGDRPRNRDRSRLQFRPQRARPAAGVHRRSRQDRRRAGKRPAELRAQSAHDGGAHHPVLHRDRIRRSWKAAINSPPARGIAAQPARPAAPDHDAEPRHGLWLRPPLRRRRRLRPARDPRRAPLRAALRPSCRGTMLDPAASSPSWTRRRAFPTRPLASPRARSSGRLPASCSASPSTRDAARPSCGSPPASRRRRRPIRCADPGRRPGSDRQAPARPSHLTRRTALASVDARQAPANGAPRRKRCTHGVLSARCCWLPSRP